MEALPVTLGGAASHSWGTAAAMAADSAVCSVWPLVPVARPIVYMAYGMCSIYVAYLVHVSCGACVLWHMWRMRRIWLGGVWWRMRRIWLGGVWWRMVALCDICSV